MISVPVCPSAFEWDAAGGPASCCSTCRAGRRPDQHADDAEQQGDDDRFGHSAVTKWPSPPLDPLLGSGGAQFAGDDEEVERPSSSSGTISMSFKISV